MGWSKDPGPPNGGDTPRHFFFFPKGASPCTFLRIGGYYAILDSQFLGGVMAVDCRSFLDGSSFLLFSLILAFALLATLCACGGNKAKGA